MVEHLRKGTISSFEKIAITNASENGLTVFKKECVEYLAGKTYSEIKSTATFLSSMKPVKCKCLHHTKKLKQNHKL